MHGSMIRNQLKDESNYLLGVEENSDDSFILKAEQLLRQIKDDRTKEILLAQINALVIL